LVDREKENKSVMVVIRRRPEDGPAAVEGLRMAVGQSISNSVTVALVDAGVRLIALLESDAPGTDEARKHLAMLARLGQRVWAEAESLDRHGLETRQLPDEVRAVERREVDEEMLASDSIMVY